MKKINGKIIFMLFSIMWGRIQEHTTNFEHLVHETWPRTCGRVVFKFYKKQTKFENHEICQDVMISYVEAVIKIWGGFTQVVTYCNTLGVWLLLIAFHFINMCIIYLIMPLLLKHAYATFSNCVCFILECCE